MGPYSGNLFDFNVILFQRVAAVPRARLLLKKLVVKIYEIGCFAAGDYAALHLLLKVL
jgi:hypothetical protein